MKIIKHGIYALFDGDELVYIGQSVSLFARIGQHIRQAEKDFDNFELFPLPDEFPESSLTFIESEIIHWFVPKYNINGAPTHLKGHTYKTKEKCIKAIQRIIDRETPKYIRETQQEYELMPPQFCYCKDCAYNKNNRVEKAYDMPWQVRDHMTYACFRMREMVKDEPTFEFDGCMRGLPMCASKYYDSRMTKEQENKYLWYFKTKYTQKEEA